jgi:hypothetical protein
VWLLSRMLPVGRRKPWRSQRSPKRPDRDLNISPAPSISRWAITIEVKTRKRQGYDAVKHCADPSPKSRSAPSLPGHVVEIDFWAVARHSGSCRRLPVSFTDGRSPLSGTEGLQRFSSCPNSALCRATHLARPDQ